MDYWFGSHIDTDNIETIPPLLGQSDWRYSLVIPFRNRPIDGPTAIVVMKNPSQAGLRVDGRVKSDMTVYKLCHYFFVRHYSKLIVLNLFGRYGTDLDTVPHTSAYDLVGPRPDWRANDRVIHYYLRRLRHGTDTVAVAWGDKNKVRGSRRDYDRRISMVVRRLRRYATELWTYPSNGEYPVHPADKASWMDWEELVHYTIED